MHSLFLQSPPIYFLLPTGLCVYYLIVTLIVGCNQPQGVIVPKYEPPAGMTPAVMRYLLNGSTDRKSVAAVLVHLAAHKLISIQPENGDYRIKSLTQQVPEILPPEEAAAMRAILEVQSLVNPASTNYVESGSFVLQPRKNKYVSLIGSVISGAINTKVEKVFFQRNIRFIAPAVCVSMMLAFGTAGQFEQHGNGVFFLTMWFMFCSFIVGIITAMSLAPLLRDVFRGRAGGMNVGTTMIPLCMFGGVLGLVDWRIGKSSTPGFAYALVAIVAINIVFGISLKRLTPYGRKQLDDILGFRQFLASVELDQLNRINDPRMTPALLNDYLAYAIALDLKDAWGDHLSNALFATATSAG